VDSLFAYHRLNELGTKKAEAVAEAFTTLLNSLRSLCPENTREFSLVKTQLEAACFYAKKSVALEPENQAGHTLPDVVPGQCSSCGYPNGTHARYCTTNQMKMNKGT
jgi:hypothetical protein